MKLASGDSPRIQRPLYDIEIVDPRSGTSPRDLAHLAYILMIELGACLQMITSDIAHAADLDVARARWLQRLTALTALIERAHGTHPIGNPAPHVKQRSPVSGHSGVQPPRLTAREREIMALTRKGLPPRKIAQRLQLSVETVYTHLRNARRKQRVIDSLKTS